MRSIARSARPCRSAGGTLRAASPSSTLSCTGQPRHQREGSETPLRGAGVRAAQAPHRGSAPTRSSARSDQRWSAAASTCPIRTCRAAPRSHRHARSQTDVVQDQQGVAPPPVKLLSRCSTLTSTSSSILIVDTSSFKAVSGQGKAPFGQRVEPTPEERDSWRPRSELMTITPDEDATGVPVRLWRP